MFCHFWQIFENSNGRHFWGGENFLKTAKIAFLRYPVGRKFCTVKEIDANLCFAIFGKNSKWAPFLGRGKFFENCQEYNAQIPCGLKIWTKLLYLAQLRR